jgi:hypothetical protein
VDSFNIVFSSYGFVLNLFPVYSSMRKDCRASFNISVYLALGFVFITYLVLTLLSTTYFGAADVSPSLFDNFCAKSDLLSKSILAIFFVTLQCNIPFAFFAGKIAV